MEIGWLNYGVIIVITAFIVSILTENSVIKRIKGSEGTTLVYGKCRLLSGYGKLPEDSVNLTTENKKLKEMLKFYEGNK